MSAQLALRSMEHLRQRLADAPAEKYNHGDDEQAETSATHTGRARHLRNLNRRTNGDGD